MAPFKLIFPRGDVTYVLWTVVSLLRIEKGSCFTFGALPRARFQHVEKKTLQEGYVKFDAALIRYVFLEGSLV